MCCVLQFVRHYINVFEKSVTFLAHQVYLLIYYTNFDWTNFSRNIIAINIFTTLIATNEKEKHVRAYR